MVCGELIVTKQEDFRPLLLAVNGTVVVFYIENSPAKYVFLNSNRLKELSVTNVPLTVLSIHPAELSLQSLTLVNTELSSFDTSRYPNLQHVDIQ